MHFAVNLCTDMDSIVIKAIDVVNHDILLSDVNFMDSGAKSMHCDDHTSMIDIREC